MSISNPRKPLLAAVASFALFAAACNQESNGVAAPSGSISEMVSAAQRAAAVPGLVAGVITSTDVQTAAAGLRKAGGSPALSTSDRMHLGSNIKAMTATLVATLVENGVLRWTTTITEVFPEFATTTRAEYGAVTVEQLLAHRGGILPLDDRASLAQLPPLPGDEVQARVALTQWLLQQPSAASPGAASLYSNGGYAIVAAMLERLTAQRFEDLLTARVLRPLGIEPKFDWPAAGDVNQPWGHEPVAGQWVANDPNAATNRIPAFLTPAGNLSLSVSDYAKFVQRHLRGLRGAAELISAQDYQYLHTPIGRYALGWVVATDNGVRTSAHDGTAGTFYALVAIRPERDRAVVVLVNAYSADAANAANTLAIKLLDRG